MTLLTRKNQTPLELSQEFFTALQKADKIDGIELMVQKYCEIEPNEKTDTKALEHYEANFTKGVSDIRMLPFMEQNKFPMSLTFLNWVCAQCNGHTVMFECMMGMLATVFFHDHYKTERMTLQWLKDNDAAVWVSNKDMWYWHLASLCKVSEDPTEFKSAFVIMKPEDYYTFKV